MQEIFVTVSVMAKDKLDAVAFVKDKLKCGCGSEIVGVSTDNPYDTINQIEMEDD